MNPYVEAARPRTLPAAVTPVFVGTAAAAQPFTDLRLDRALLALLVALSLQVAVNYANDLFDGLRGVDTRERTGPRRAVASGLISPARMRVAMVVALALAAVAGTLLAWMVGWELLIVGGLAMVAALGYSGGRRPYASRGLGEVSVFLFFGLVATVGSAYVQDQAIGRTPMLAAIPVGLLAVALLVVNNLRDIPTDEAAGKRTLAVRIGATRTRQLYQLLIAGSLVGLLPVALSVPGWWPLLGLVALPIALRTRRAIANAPLGRELVPVLEATGRVQLVLGLGLTVGLVLSGTVTTAGGAL